MYTIEGTVIEGKKRGKKLGFPTANLIMLEDIPQGIYISETIIESDKYKSATFVGNSKTFGEIEIFIETYILDFDKEIYGTKIRVNLIKKIRENIKFDTIKDLTDQIKKDVNVVRNYYKK